MGRVLACRRRPHRGRPAQLRLAQPVPGGAEPPRRVEARAHPLRAGRVGRRRTSTARHDRRHGLEHDPRQPRARARRTSPPPVDVPDEPFGVVSSTASSCSTTASSSRARSTRSPSTRARMPLLFVDHPVTAAAIGSSASRASADRPTADPAAHVLPVRRALRARARSSFTDSGGSQEECFYLDRPCLVHRMKTERQEGLGENVVLSRLRLRRRARVPRRPVAAPTQLRPSGHTRPRT